MPAPAMAWAALLAVLAALASAEEEESCPAGGACGGEAQALAATDGTGHYWPRCRGHPGTYGSTRLVGPSNLSASLDWIWEHPDRHILPGAVLIDADRNIYASAMDGVRKFSPEGEILWFYKSDGYTISNPSISNDTLFGSTYAGHLFALDMETGQERWSVKHMESCEMDCPNVEVWDGVVLAAFDRAPSNSSHMPGNVRVLGVQALTGEKLWERLFEKIHWNFSPVFVGDGSFLIMDVHGGLSRLAVKDGRLLWHVQEAPEYNESFTDGGVNLGPGSQVAYTCSNKGDGGSGEGMLRAYRVSDGELLWHQDLPLPCVSWPAVDPNNHTVVVPIGPLPLGMPPAVMTAFPLLVAVLGGVLGFLYTRFAARLMKRPCKSMLRLCWYVNVFFNVLLFALPILHWWSLHLGVEQYQLWQTAQKPMQVCAFDAQSGEPNWCYDDIPPWGKINSRNDEEDYVKHLLKGHTARPFCAPSSWSAPTIDGRGTVYVTGMNGILYGIRDANQDNIIDSDTEVSQLDLESAALHAGPAFAPGMMAVGSCNRIQVFRL